MLITQYPLNRSCPLTEPIVTYEHMGLIYPQPQLKRPIVLIGAENIGRTQLRQRLMDTYPDRFAPAKPRWYIYNMH